MNEALYFFPRRRLLRRLLPQLFLRRLSLIRILRRSGLTCGIDGLTCCINGINGATFRIIRLNLIHAE